MAQAARIMEILQEMIHIGIMTTEILKLSRLLKPLIQNR